MSTKFISFACLVTFVGQSLAVRAEECVAPQPTLLSKEIPTIIAATEKVTAQQSSCMKFSDYSKEDKLIAKRSIYRRAFRGAIYPNPSKMSEEESEALKNFESIQNKLAWASLPLNIWGIIVGSLPLMILPAIPWGLSVLYENHWKKEIVSKQLGEQNPPSPETETTKDLVAAFNPLNMFHPKTLATIAGMFGISFLMASAADRYKFLRWFAGDSVNLRWVNRAADRFYEKPHAETERQRKMRIAKNAAKTVGIASTVGVIEEGIFRGQILKQTFASIGVKKTDELLENFKGCAPKNPKEFAQSIPESDIKQLQKSTFRKANAIQSFIFALMHLNPIGIPYLAFGYMAGELSMDEQGNVDIRKAIAAHAWYDFIAFLLHSR